MTNQKSQNSLLEKYDIVYDSDNIVLGKDVLIHVDNKNIILNFENEGVYDRVLYSFFLEQWNISTLFIGYKLPCEYISINNKDSIKMDCNGWYIENKYQIFTLEEVIKMNREDTINNILK